MTRRLLVLAAIIASVLAAAPTSATAASRCVVAPTVEARPMNTPFNRTRARVGVDYDPATAWPTWAFDDSSYRRRVDGARTGTTDELVQWAACKWQLPVDVLRAVTALESWGDMTTLGDGGASRGITQIKVGAPTHTGVTVAATLSTAWNLDYYSAMLRACLDGHMVLWRDRPDLTRRPYTRGDLWGCVEAWFTGVGPTTWSAWYSDRARAYLEQRRWTWPDYVTWTGWRAWCSSVTSEEASGYWNCTTGQGS